MRRIGSPYHFCRIPPPRVCGAHVWRGPAAEAPMYIQDAVQTPTLQRYVARYSTSHQNKVNQRLHLIGIPLIVIAVLGVLARLRVSTVDLPTLLQPNLGLALMAFVCGWYLV